MSVVTVSSSAALSSAIQVAHAGDTIQLAAGEYVLGKIQNLTFSSAVTITSADPTHEAVIDGINLQNDSGLTFRNLEVKVDHSQKVGVIVLGGGNISLDHLNIHGTRVGDGLGVRVLNASDVTLNNLNVHDVQGGVGLAGSDTVSVLNSQIHDLQVDGVQSTGSSHVTISGNNFTNFHPKPGDHSDTIQFLTYGQTTASHDIVITNNTYVRGAGLAAQGIFMGNEAHIPYENVTISGNAIVGGVFHGIAISQVDHLNLSDNIVEGYVDQPSWILIDRSTASSETNNIATSFNPGTHNVGLVNSGNTTISPAAIGDTSILGRLHVTPNPIPIPPASTPPASTPPAAATPPLELMAHKVTYTLATVSAPAGAGQVILDPLSNVWSNRETGGAGADTLNAGLGADSLTGGAGADNFVFSDTPGGPADITDFIPGQDVVDVGGLLAGVGYTGSDPIADQVLVLQSDGAGGTQVLLDPDGSGPQPASYILHLDHVAPASLTADDFIFGASQAAAGGAPGPSGKAGSPLELTAQKVSYTLATVSAPAGGGQVILDPLSNVWSNKETGGSGADTLNAGKGADSLTGGAGADHFVIAHVAGGVHDVTDFTHGQDVLDVRGLLAEIGYRGANPIADHVFTLESDGADGTLVMLDRDGAGPAPAEGFLHLDHVAPATLTASDFIFH